MSAEVRLSDIEQALTQPVRVCEHRQYGNQQIYEGPLETAMPSRGIFPVVIVERRNATTGVVVTSWMTRRAYRGVQRWP
jgi:hypothetical protein